MWFFYSDDHWYRKEINIVIYTFDLEKNTCTCLFILLRNSSVSLTEFSCKRNCYLNSEDPLSQCLFPNKENSGCFHSSNAEWSLTQCWHFTSWKCSGHQWRLNVCLWKPELSQEGKDSREPRKKPSSHCLTKIWSTSRKILDMTKKR